MSFNWDDYLNQADELFLKSDEAGYRSAISRAYYSSFHKSVPTAIKHCGFLLKNSREDHAGVRNALRSNPDLIKLGVKLGKLNFWRSLADYDDKSIESKLAETSLEWAKEINSGIENYSKTHPL